ncbi:hypothetical protein SCHPADRAFT_947700 [Schizopora paradoxa]|uniref:Uncharacterized protein n=1 Tax=Schizopora paradoxa TaxID=27342 RepID=A0A0H2QZM8_9AGAM|nr:hypothetical protein SCHPADRAFT_947700 [Schizopora paradoxa]
MGNVLGSMLDRDEVRLVRQLFQSLGFARFYALVRSLVQCAKDGYIHLKSGSGGRNASYGGFDHGGFLRPLVVKMKGILHAPMSFGASESNNVKSPNASVHRHSSLYDLSDNLLLAISCRFQKVPHDEWLPLMYTCKAWHNMLSGEYLSGVGFLHTPEPGVISSRSFMQLVRIDSFLALPHWRLSQYFASVDEMGFHLSSQATIREIELTCVGDFFASLPQRRRNIGKIHLFINDWYSLSEPASFLDVLTQLHRTGCTEFWFYSSYFAELLGMCNRFLQIQYGRGSRSVEYEVGSITETAGGSFRVCLYTSHKW